MADERRRPSILLPLRRFSLQDGHGVEAGADLDEEMAKVFVMADDDRFNVAKFATSPDSVGSKRSFSEKDYSFHRKHSYPHTHVPLKPLHSKSTRRKVSTQPSDLGAVEELSAPQRDDTRKLSHPAMSLGSREPVKEESGSGFLSGMTSPEEDEGKDDPVFSSESEAQISERAAFSGDSPLFGSPTDPYRRVQFQIGDADKRTPTTAETVETELGAKKDEAPPEPEKQRKRSRHHHHKSRDQSLQEDPQWRKRQGSDFGLPEERRLVSQEEESSTLNDPYLDDLSNHRFEETKRQRRFKIQTNFPSVIHIGRKDGEEDLQKVVPLPLYKKMFDHSPHEVFVQLDELQGQGEDREWKETARWIKYEEDVEEGADRWGRPHVASLSFHSLLNLRRCLETGVVLLDLEEKDLPGVAYRVVEQMVVEELIQADDKASIMRALLLRHRHVNEYDRFRFAMKRSFSSYTSLQNLNEEKSKPRSISSTGSTDNVPSSKTNSFPKLDGNQKNEKNDNHLLDIKEETYTASNEDLRRAQKEKESILKRIPVGAEATTVLVGSVDFLHQPTIAFVRLAEGILMPAITEVTIPVRFLFILLGPSTADLDYHEIGRSISTLMSNAQFHNIAYKAVERRELLSAINEFLDDSIVLPPGDWERKALLPFGELKAKSDAIRRRKNTRLLDPEETQKVMLLATGDEKRPPDDPLQRTKRPFGGLVNDIKRRFPHYVSDFKDGCNSSCLAASLFMYFAALSGAITFGGLMGDKTNNLIGISETLVSTSIFGVIFALCAGQPLIIIGTTGPLLLFDESLYSFCLTYGVSFLTTRFYIGIWLFVIALVVVCFEGSVFVKLFTRFTEEIFAALISLLYIVESFMKLYNVFRTHPVLESYCSAVENATSCNETSLKDSKNKTLSGLLGIDYYDDGDSNATVISEEIPVINQPNTALFCLILALGTFFIAYYMRHFRNSQFLGRNARRALGDFGVPIAIATMVFVDYLTSAYTEKLSVPEGLSPSKPNERGWIVDPSNLPAIWVAICALPPAFLVYILLFMETHICELIIDKKERKLKKGSGFHMDILLLCFLNVGCGIMGAPWICAATVRSISHVAALTVMSRTHAPGEKPHIIEVKEQRLSGLIVSIFIGISVLMAPLLRLVPIAVLFGVFLYMGISSMDGIQFFERVRLIFMPVKHHPQVPYVRRVRTLKMHLFTLIQLLCLAVLWIVKSTPAALGFPFFLILMVPLRLHLRYLFTPEELRALDSDEVGDADDDEPDFYKEALLPG